MFEANLGYMNCCFKKPAEFRASVMAHWIMHLLSRCEARVQMSRTHIKASRTWRGSCDSSSRITCLPRLAEWIILDSVERPVSMSKVESNWERFLSSLALPFCLQVLCDNQQVGKEKVGTTSYPPSPSDPGVPCISAFHWQKSQLGLRTSRTPMSRLRP